MVLTTGDRRIVRSAQRAAADTRSPGSRRRVSPTDDNQQYAPGERVGPRSVVLLAQPDSGSARGVAPASGLDSSLCSSCAAGSGGSAVSFRDGGPRSLDSARTKGQVCHHWSRQQPPPGLGECPHGHALRRSMVIRSRLSRHRLPDESRVFFGAGPRLGRGNRPLPRRHGIWDGGRARGLRLSEGWVVSR